MPLTGALKEWVAKLKAYQDKHHVSYKAAMSALKGTGSKGRRKSHRGGSGDGVAANAEAFTPQGDASPQAPPHAPAAAAGAATHPSPPPAAKVDGFEVKALPQSGGGGLSMFEVGATADAPLQQGGRRRRGSRRGRRGSRGSRGSQRSSRRNQKQQRQQRRSRSRRGGSGSSLSYSDYA